jgi:hypothetical protein
LLVIDPPSRAPYAATEAITVRPEDSGACSKHRWRSILVESTMAWAGNDLGTNMTAIVIDPVDSNINLRRSFRWRRL